MLISFKIEKQMSFLNLLDGKILSSRLSMYVLSIRIMKLYNNIQGTSMSTEQVAQRT